MLKKDGGQNNYEIYSNYIYIFFFSNIKASTILDYETEIFINDILNIVKDVNNYKKEINYRILLDDNPNAYVDKNNELYISTGLLKYIDSYEGLVGVLAHEIGHIENFHIAKRKKTSENLKSIDSISNISIIAGSLITQNTDILMKSMITNKLGINNYFQSFSRDQEREADYYAINTLKKLKLSNYPLIKFLNFLEKKTIQKGVTKDYFKFSTHPIYKERYEIIEANNSYTKNNFDKEINQRFKYIRAKLFGYTETDIDIIENYLEGDFFEYSNSIFLSKKGELKKSMKGINSLLRKKNNYIYLLETKADILYSHGYLKESLLFYDQAIQKNPYNNYINIRIFEINYKLLLDKKDMNLSKNLFYKNLFLLEKFFENKDLYVKFQNLAQTANIKLWSDFFIVYDNFYDKKIDIIEYKNKLNNIKNNTSEIILINIIKKEILNKNENI